MIETSSSGKMKIKNNLIQSTPKRKRYQKDTTTTSDDINTLIALVRENPALYNYKLQPSCRKRQDVLIGWQHIADQLDNKYTVEECRRKWKNLRDTYHQYRLRKPKIGDSLAKWRYAKDLDFLSTVYQPKLRSQRQPQCNDVTSQILQVAAANSDSVKSNMDEVMGGHHHGSHHSGITLVNDGEDAFILTTYEESVNDDIATIDHSHDCNSELGLNYRHHRQKGGNYDDDDQVVNHIIKSEGSNPLDSGDDGADGEVDYEEVCLYEEAGNDQNECETIIPCNSVNNRKINNSSNNSNSNNGSAMNSVISTTSDKEFQYSDFCIDTIQPHSTASGNVSGSNVSTNVLSGSNPKIKSIIGTVVDGQTAAIIAASGNAETIDCTVGDTTLTSGETVPTSIIQFPLTNNSGNNAVICHGTNFSGVMQIRHELDLYFDFLKQKMQRFSKEEITAIQIDMLNCVLKRENSANNTSNTSATSSSGGNIVK